MRILLVIALVLIPSSLVQSQNTSTIDSLLIASKQQVDDTNKVRTLNSIVRHYMYRDGTLAKTYASTQLALAKKLEDVIGVSAAHYQYGNIYYNERLEDSIRFHYGEALKYGQQLKHHVLTSQAMNGLATYEFSLGNLDKAERMNDALMELNIAANDSTGIALNHQFKGRVNQNRGYYTIALNETLKAYDLFALLENEIRMADAMNTMGTLERNFSNLDKAIEYKKEALITYEKENDTYYASEVYNDLGAMYMDKEDYKMAQQQFERGLALSRSVGFVSVEVTCLRNLGEVARLKKEYETAMKYFEESMQKTHSIKNLRKVAGLQNKIAQVYNETNRPNQALKILEPSISYSTESNSPSMLSFALSVRSDTYSLLGDHQAALQDFKDAEAISDSLFGVEQSRQAEEMRAQFDLERKENQLQLQQNEIALLEQQETINGQQKLLLGLGLFFVLVLSGFGFYSFRQKIKRNQVEKEIMDADLEHKKKELTTHALHLAKKNEVLVSLKEQVEALAQEKSTSNFREILNTINFDLKDEENWEYFTQYFEQVHKNFGKEVQQKYPEVTPNELRFMALLKMNLTSKEIANMLSITPDGVKKARQRLRKKMQLTPEDSLEAVVMSI